MFNKFLFTKNIDNPVVTSQLTVALIENVKLALRQHFNNNPTHVLVTYYRVMDSYQYSSIDIWNGEEAARLLFFLDDHISFPEDVNHIMEDLDRGVEIGLLDHVDIFYFMNEIIRLYSLKNYTIQNNGIVFTNH